MALEWQLFLAILIVGILPFLRRKRAIVFGSAVALMAVGVGAGWSVKQYRSDFARHERAKTLPKEGRPGGYVSSDTCRSCHPGQFESWHRSYHRTMTQYATPQAVKGDFNDVTLELAGDQYRLEKRGDEFWVEMPDPDWRRAAAYGPRRPETSQPERVWRRIGLTTGSHHMQTYWVPSARGNLQINFPFSYLFREQRWVPRNDTFLMDPAIPPGVQIWNANCLQCHATAGQPRPEQGDPFLVDTRVAEIGISCEACHGPAEEHIRAQQNPMRRHAERNDDTLERFIVNPAKLDHKKSSLVCGQCHSVKWLPPGHAWRFEGFQYRPGGEADPSLPFVLPRLHADEAWLKDGLRREPAYIEERFWADGSVRVSGREYNGLLESPCYQRGTMSCLSCHSQHESDPNDQLARHMDSNAACLQCHKTMDVARHTHHTPTSSGSSCYNCHMPHTTYGLMKAIRSHTINSPRVESTLKTGRPNACNLCHLDQTLEWTGKKLAEWYGQPIPALSADQKNLSAAATLALSGDAGQRALIAWHMGWEPARQASGENWLPPFLAQLIDDPYSTVRYIAQRSLKELPEYREFSYDFIAMPAARSQSRERAMAIWQRKGSFDARPAVAFDTATWTRLLRARNNRPMYLKE